VRPFPYTNTTAANFPTALFNEWLNIASFETYGADFESNYRMDLFNHPLALRALVSWQPHLIFNQGPAGTIDLGNTATGVNLYPATSGLKFTLLATYDFTDRFSMTAMVRGRESMKAIGVVEGQPQKVFLNGNNRDPATAWVNLSATYKLPDSVPGQSEVYGTIQNLFNKQPDVVYAGANSSPGVGLGGFFPPNGDDIVGRYFTVGFRAHF
jgi:outer membrane receptor protein involved in Fe transport